MKKFVVPALSLALCLGLVTGCSSKTSAPETSATETTAANGSESAASESTESTEPKAVDSLKIAFSPYADADTITTATEPLENLLKEELLTKGYDVADIDMTVGTSYTAVGEALSAGSADIGFISGGNYVLFSDDCDVLLTALRYAINKDSEDPKDWNDGTIEENTDAMSTYYRSIILAGPSAKGQELLAKVNNGEELTWDQPPRPATSIRLCGCRSVTEKPSPIWTMPFSLTPTPRPWHALPPDRLMSWFPSDTSVPKMPKTGRKSWAEPMRW